MSTSPLKSSVSNTRSLTDERKKLLHNSSPSTAQDIDAPTRKRPRSLKQTHFATTMRKTVCSECQMSYMQHLKSDRQLHEKYHQRAVEGMELGPTITLVWSSIEHHQLKSGVDGKIVEVNIESSKQISVAEEFLDIVNNILSAPQDNRDWSFDPNRGKVFLFVIRSKAVGICSTERISEGKWMVYDTGQLVPKQRIPLIIGISRIYVSHKYRRMGIGLRLLVAVQHHSIYGLTLARNQIGWSQPSEFGGKLALSFNGVKHKSGKMLIPIYEER
ncbi:hypothetical protein KL921_001258 [Ogataea angusta]|uniref:N-acetyltransferase ECO1 n=1 Tax=Pichia angusta TaxID=870730 RepID=A0AAN6I725_PICAN|nr:uncharacterized protein KL928_001422 [Ogataea angusta]KAG7813712.1 hypothetical protein KL921_001258 [Ogataea angusta]KAG7821338.1 hypothetical protein KL928_001422 [Ogataea angusta]KAG7825962.1 hypothetical protein KL909_000014 [Ogataea angusta]KAG7836465.1 hypothetical protein KL943_002114 [Ogataea angusta]KAG7843532.1 hypothetical protein KL942_000628 [Ogataea angusta]